MHHISDGESTIQQIRQLNDKVEKKCNNLKGIHQYKEMPLLMELYICSRRRYNVNC